MCDKEVSVGPTAVGNLTVTAQHAFCHAAAMNSDGKRYEKQTTNTFKDHHVSNHDIQIFEVMYFCLFAYRQFVLHGRYVSEKALSA